MNITLNKHSWHFKIYSKVISETPPKSLCPYFWSMIALTVFSPGILLFFGLKKVSLFFDRIIPKKKKTKKDIFSMTKGELDEEYKKLKKSMKRSEIAGKIVFGFWITFMFIIVIVGAYFGIQKDGLFVFLRMIFSLIGIATSIYWFIRGLIYVIPKIRESNVYRVPVEMIKAVYTKTCPIINWK